MLSTEESWLKYMDDKCMKCGKTLISDEIGLHKKLLGRMSQQYLCIDCCAEHFKVTRSLLEYKIEEYKSMGCKLFEQ